MFTTGGRRGFRPGPEPGRRGAGSAAGTPTSPGQPSGGAGRGTHDGSDSEVVITGAPATTWAESADGFAGAFTSLFSLAYRVAYRILGDRGDAEDVAQEALARAHVRWRALAERPEGWVVRVAANLAIDRTRRRRRALPTAVVPVGTADPATAERLDLVRALDRLPRRQRQVVVLRYLADRSELDVARELGCSVGTVKSSAARGLQALRRRLEGDVEGESVVPTP